MNITLAQAVPLRGIISKRIQELLQERNSVAFVEVSKGQEFEAPERTIEQVTSELQQAREDFLLLDEAMAEANLTKAVKWDDETISITRAIEKSKQLRGEVNALKGFGNRKKQERQTNWRTDEVTIVHAQYEPEEYRKEALKIERQVNRLSQEIEATNHRVEFTFTSASRYLEY